MKVLIINILILTLSQIACGQGRSYVRDSVLLITPENSKVLSPPYFNIATGKRISATATCGNDGAERFCKLTGGTNYEFHDNLHQGQVCDICDASDPRKSHPIENAIDGTERWWQSPPLSRGNQYNKINITIDLGQVFHVAYVLIKFANSPRAGTWVLERSSDGGKTFQPWQYFANTVSDCYNFFGEESEEGITRDDSVICTEKYSTVVPLENGEVIIPLVKGRPGDHNFSYATVLQEWSKATTVRIRLLRTKTLLGHLMAVSQEDPTVTRRYYYSIKDISIGGRCVCNGHANRCSSDPSDRYKLKCACQHNTCGDSCEMCCPGFVQKKWRAAVPESTNECEECNCHGHSNECVYDEEIAERRLSLDKYGKYEGGGRCLNCEHNTAGINCEMCAEGYWRPDDIDARSPYGCRPCECDSEFTVGTCEPTTGRCYCKPQYAGDRCDQCAPGYYDFPTCKECDCYYNGTLNDICLPVDDACPCKYNFAGMYCDMCAPTFYDFPTCKPCDCEGEGVASNVCDQETGNCQCQQGFTGPNCRQCAPGFYNYPFCARCACSAVGTTEDVCNSETGECYCQDRYEGNTCDVCKDGYYGFPKCQTCKCTSPGSENNSCDKGSGKCTCKPNYSGDNCDQCSANHYGYPECRQCKCNADGSTGEGCDPVTGQCVCKENVSGRSCDECVKEFFNYPTCEECSCNKNGIKESSPDVCLAFTVGQCDCKDNVQGKNCDECKPLFYDISNGCVNCNCFVQGTLDGVAECDKADGQCFCKPYTCTQRCSQCEEGFWGLDERNYFGCKSCKCDVGGATSEKCDMNNGKCQCRENVSGRRCNRPKKLHYFASLHNIKEEFENGYGPDRSQVRFGFDESVFPEFSYKGYTEFTNIQKAIIVEINVEEAGLYRLLFRYQNNRQVKLSSRVTLMALERDLEDGTEQTYNVEFPVNVGMNKTSASTMYFVPVPFVLNKGTWKVIVEADNGLILDYFVLLPSDYYEPNILEQSVHQPCKPAEFNGGNNGECLMFTHPELTSYNHVYINDLVDESRLRKPTSAHPNMTYVSGNSGDETANQMTFDMRVSDFGAYVLVMEYASSSREMQHVEINFKSATEEKTAYLKFFSCEYSFNCRQVALDVLDGVQVFDFNMMEAEITVKAKAGQSFYILRAYAIPVEEWSLQLVEPKAKCITKRGPSFEKCMESLYPIPPNALKFDISSQADKVILNGHSMRPETILDENVPLVMLDGSDINNVHSRKSLTVSRGSLEFDKYVFMLHYYNPRHTSFESEATINSSISQTGTFDVKFCPHAQGCRAVFTTSEGNVVVDNLENSPVSVQISVPESKSFWVEYIMAVPESSYNPSLFDVDAIDKSPDFLRLCNINEQQNGKSSDFCEKSSFSLSVKYNDGAKPCGCSEAGTEGGAKAQCEMNGGQCPCKDNVIGRQCTECKVGYYDYPNCKPCNCGGLVCENDGTCICPTNTNEPDCLECKPEYHSWDVIQGCLECSCNPDGVKNATEDMSCNKETGQCNCQDNVTGQQCDKCAPGYYGFPNCQKCTCDDRGSNSEGCDPQTGQCSCKNNVEGLRCDRCKEGSFHLHEDNEDGCIECFCSGKSTQCHFSNFPATTIDEMNGWNVVGLKTKDPSLFLESDGGKVTLRIAKDDDYFDNTKPQHGLYWEAPESYRNDKIASYGGQLKFVRQWSRPSTGRGDSPSSTTVTDLTGSGQEVKLPDIILKNDDYEVGYFTPNRHMEGEMQIQLSERNFKHLTTMQPVTRPEMMRLLNGLSKLRILASPINNNSPIVSLRDVSMETTDYSLKPNPSEAIPGVEECICPEGYSGHSCEQCSLKYYADYSAGADVVCRRCDCYPNCDVCDDNGQLRGHEDCLHNTGGENCKECKVGYYGNSTTDGVVTNCMPCSCPFPEAEGNFADSCSEVDGELMCMCDDGYAGATCDMCAEGFYGNPAVLGGTCKPCNCNGNLDSNLLIEACDTLTGECKNCMFNTGGKNCEKCADGYYGDAIDARDCRKCDCDECGTEECNHANGACTCKDNVEGYHCDRCEVGYWGFESCNGCKACDCGEASVGTLCDVISGQCTCQPNVVGQKCDKCAPGFWNYGPEGCKPCNCRNGGNCNPVNGECECPPGITGDQCDECEEERYVLHPGQSSCERCGKCTDDLLDKVEEMTVELKSDYEKLKNVSVGVFAHQRLSDLNNKVNNYSIHVSETQDMLENAFELVNDVGTDQLIKNLDFDVSGSGIEDEETDGSGFSKTTTMFIPDGGLTDMPEPDTMLNEFVSRLSVVDDPVSKMCEKVDNLTMEVQLTMDDVLLLSEDAMDLEDLADNFANTSVQLLDSIQMDISSNSEELNKNLEEAKILINEIRLMNLTTQNDVALQELQLSQALLNDIELNFTDPSASMEMEINDVMKDLEMRHEKLRDLRNKLNDAQETTNVARDANSVNSKNLTELTDIINGINMDLNMAGSDLNVAEDQVKLAVLSISKTDQMVSTELDLINENLEENLKNMTIVHNDLNKQMTSLNDSLYEAIDHAVDLQEKTKSLQSIEMKESKPTEVANRWNNIAKAVEKAEQAANQALNASENAAANAAEKNLETAAKESQNAASELLADITSVKDNKLKAIQDSENAAAETIKSLEDSRDELMEKLSKLESEVNGVGSDPDFNDTLNDVLFQSQQTKSTSQTVSDDADTLDEVLDKVDDVITDIPLEMVDLRTKVASVKGSLLSNKAAWVNAANAKNKVVEKLNELKLGGKIEELRKKIQLTRNKANLVKANMKFDAAKPHQSELRVPTVMTNPAHSIEMTAQLRVSSGALNNNVIMLKDTRAGGDYVSLTTKDGYAVFSCQVGGGTASITSAQPINDDGWRKIVIKTNGNLVSMKISKLQDGGEFVEQESLEDVTTSDDLVATISQASMQILLGGWEGASAATGNTEGSSFCISSLTLGNGEKAGLYNYIDYNGTLPAKQCRESLKANGLPSSQSWRFSGVNSYLKYELKNAFKASAAPGKPQFIGFTMLSSKSDGLLFVIGNDVKQFLAMEVVAGKIQMIFNFGFKTTKSIPLGRSIEAGKLVIRAGYITTIKTVAVTVNGGIPLRVKWSDDDCEVAGCKPQLNSNIWVGGSWCDDVPDALEEHVVNLRTHYRGYISQLSFNGRVTLLKQAAENIGVSIGSSEETIKNIEMDGSSYIAMTSSSPDAASGSGGVSFCSAESSGGIITVFDDQEKALISTEEVEAEDDADSDVESLDKADKEDSDVVIPEVRPVTEETEATTTKKVPPAPKTTTEYDEYGFGETETPIEDARQVAPKSADSDDKNNGTSAGSLTIVVAVIAAVVLISLLAAVVSAFRSPPTALPGPGPAAAAESVPLQQQQAAQMDW